MDHISIRSNMDIHDSDAMKNQIISDLQKRRADNIIWNCAKDYSFVPDFKAYDHNGEVDLYWNVIYGSARRHYEYEKLEKFFAMLDRYRNSAVYESIFWNALEPVLFRTELRGRPVLERMRPVPVDTDLKFDDKMTTDGVVETAREYFYEHYGLYGDGRIRLKYRLLHLRRLSVDSFLQRGRVVVHEKDLSYGPAATAYGDFSISTKLTESELRDFLETKFGKSVFTFEQVAGLEKQLCTGNHRFTHLFYTRGEVAELRGVYNTFEMHQRKRQAELVANNRAFYQENLLQNRLQISRLSTSIMNSILLHMQPAPVRSNAGALNPALVWRAAKLGDERVFTRTENENAGDMSVDILLDASHSQFSRAAKISSQAYIISEALSRCHVPCRVMSFCSMSGFTILRLFNEYSSSDDNSSIFDYYTEGCNRDGLAIRAAGNLILRTTYEHRMLIVLSDVKPLDVAKIRKDERDVGVNYDEGRALNDTAREVRSLRAEGVSVICIFTGTDESLPSARMVYGQDFVRIRDFSLFADTVGKLIIDQIKNASM
ncbi:MAG: hypothetical protein K6C08_03970 [Oscillospiraceae bacterium]|nr:hypothetical protein [Oscillospiraceae bacterium]